MADIYIELKSWQTAIGSVLGFIALILGALFNYRLNRRRDERMRREEVLSVASALYGEVVILRRSVARMANAVGRRYMRHGLHGDAAIDRYFVEQFALPKPKLYPTLASKVGILDSQLALEIVIFYSRFEEAETWLPRLDDDVDRGFSYGVKYVLDPAIEAVMGVLPALRVIENMAGIPEPAAVLDLSPAINAQEIENIHNEA